MMAQVQRPPTEPSLTEILRDWRDSAPESLAAVLPHVCRDLQAMARSQMAQEGPGNTLQATALVNEFFLRLAARQSFNWNNRRQFFGFAAETMRRILVDHARVRGRQKRGDGHRPLSLNEALDVPEPLIDDVVALNDALLSLSAIDPRKARIVDLRFFIGLTVEETAAILRLSAPTIKREWRAAKLWLLREIRRA